MAHPLRIKICGITNATDARLAAELGADAVGINFHRQSPRYVEATAVKEILRSLPLFIEAVGVFTDLKMMCDYANWFGLRTLQWHADPMKLGKLEAEELAPFRVIVAFAIPDAASLQKVDAFLAAGGKPAAVLVDGYQKGLHGGTGQTVPWNLLADFHPGVPLILAGGLTPDNVAEAIRVVRPYAVDVASGVESRPGMKDAEKMRRFIGNAREAAAKHAAST